MRKLMKYLSGYRKESVLAPLFKLLEAFFELLVPLVMASIIDRGINVNGTGGADTGHIWRMGLCLLALAVVGLVSSITAQFFAAKAAVGFSAGLRQALFDHIQGLDFTNIDKAGTSTMITRMTSDVNQIQSGVNLVLRLFLRSPIIVFGAMIMAFTIDVKSALIFVVAIPLLAVVVFGVMMITMPMYKKVQSALDRVLGITRENLTGVRVIRAFHQEQVEEKRFREQNNALSHLQTAVARISAVMNPLTYVIVNGAIIALIYTGALQVNMGNLTQGEVVAIINYMSQILVELVKLANLIVTITKALACADRVAGVLEIPAGEAAEKCNVSAQSAAEEAGKPVGDTMQYLPPYLEFDHVSLTYQGAGDKTLQDVHFRVERGQTIGIIGGTGSAKSSLVNLISRLYDVTEGRLLVGGVDVKAYDCEVLRNQVAVVLQNNVLFSGTILENLRWGDKEATPEEVRRAAEAACAEEFVSKLPEGYDTLLGQGGVNLSGGQKQRICIARALLRKPKILILDDSTSAVDTETELKIRNNLNAMLHDTTVFIITQRINTMQSADRVIVLEDGEINAIGTPDELIKRSTVYQEIYHSQQVLF